MKYLLMLYADEKAGMAIPPEQMAGFMRQMAAYQDVLEKANAFVATAALQTTDAARTIAAPHGELTVHDGPYAETRERLFHHRGAGHGQCHPACCKMSRRRLGLDRNSSLSPRFRAGLTILSAWPFGHSPYGLLA